MERALIDEYRAHVERELAGLDAANLPRALAVAGVPETIRGFGHVKQASVAKARERWQALQEDAPAAGMAAAA